LQKVPVSGGAAILVASWWVNDPIAVGPTGIYGTGSVGEHSTITLVSAPLGAGPTVEAVPTGALGGNFASYGIVLDATSVYWIDFNGGGIGKAPLSGGEPTILAPGGGAGIAVDATSVYWGTGEALMKVPIGGGEPITLAANGSYVAVDKDFVYFTGGPYPGAVYKVAKAGGPVIVLATDQNGASGIAVDANSVYWVNTGGDADAAGSVMKLTPK
jgi:hypothetical protein